MITRRISDCNQELVDFLESQKDFIKNHQTLEDEFGEAYDYFEFQNTRENDGMIESLSFIFDSSHKGFLKVHYQRGPKEKVNYLPIDEKYTQDQLRIIIEDYMDLERNVLMEELDTIHLGLLGNGNKCQKILKFLDASEEFTHKYMEEEIPQLSSLSIDEVSLLHSCIDLLELFDETKKSSYSRGSGATKRKRKQLSELDLGSSKQPKFDKDRSQGFY